jgi:hypothetical protein
MDNSSPKSPGSLCVSQSTIYQEQKGKLLSVSKLHVN